MNPKTHVKKIYHVQAHPIPSDEELLKLSNGIILEGEKTLPARFELIRSGNQNGWIEVELHEGKNRQIRRMLESIGVDVLRLIRVQIGNLKLGDLSKGQWRELSARELSDLKNS